MIARGANANAHENPNTTGGCEAAFRIPPSPSEVSDKIAHIYANRSEGEFRDREEKKAPL